MARPTKPKDLKPKADADVGAPAKAPGAAPPVDLKFIILLVLVVVLSIAGSAGSAYVIGKYVLLPEIEKLQTADHGGDGGIDAPPVDPITEVGMNLELDEFLVALTPAKGGPKQYLRAKISLNIHVPEEENCYATHKEHSSVPADLQGGRVVGAAISVDGKELAQHGEGGDPAAACEAAFKGNMARFVPTIRDTVNTALMTQTITDLASKDGQEHLKDEIQSAVTSIMQPNYSVLRVNFEDFITQ